MAVTLDQRMSFRQRPKENPLMHQDWRELLFLHWRCNPSDIQKTLPPGLFVDTFDGDAYITITPLYMQNLSFTNFPLSLPGMSNFIEVNVRTYVHDMHGNPGIWFYSLEIDNFVAAHGARMSYYLPCHHSSISLAKAQNVLTIRGNRIGEDISFEFIYSGEEDLDEAAPESLEFFLIERYAYFSFSANKLYMGRVFHHPYPLAKSKVIRWSNSLIKANSLPVSNTEPDFIHYSSGVDVDIYNLKKV